jgi:hypothetical protein
MTTEPISAGGAPSGRKAAGARVVSGTRFPVYDLGDSIAVAKLIHERGGGSASDDELAAFLKYKSPRNGAYLGRVGAAKLFGLIEGSAKQYKLTPLAQRILMPYDESQHREGLVEAFLNVPLFKGVYDEYRGKDLPPEFGMKNLLRGKFQIIPARLSNAYRVLMDSAETAGFFATRNGARTHLIMPAIRAGTNARPPEGAEEPGGGGGGGGDTGGGGSDDGGGGSVSGLDELRREYVAMLMEMLREKAKNGEPDLDLMERIEKLLALNA